MSYEALFGSKSVNTLFSSNKLFLHWLNHVSVVDDVGYGPGNIVELVAGQSSEVDSSAGWQHIDVVFRHQFEALTGKRKKNVELLH